MAKRQRTSSRGKADLVEVIENTRDDPRIRAIIYGPSGSGKTVLAASACLVPEMSPVLLIDCATSSDAIRGEDQFSSVDIMRVKEFDGISAVHTWLHPDGGDNLAERGYQTIVLDELDSLHWQALMKLMAKNMAENPSRELNDIYMDDYGDARAMLLNVVDEFLKFDVNLIITTRTREREDIVTGRMKLQPSLAGQLRDDIPGKMGMYIYLDVDVPSRQELRRGEDPVGKRIAYFTPTHQFHAKVRGLSRAERLGAQMEDPTMAKIYRAYVGKE